VSASAASTENKIRLLLMFANPAFMLLNLPIFAGLSEMPRRMTPR
jgi:hypothetical protein